jgi:tetratricopeptide (TPR) repeat protein
MAEVTLKLHEVRLGFDHPHTLISRGNLATNYREADRLSEAISLSESNLKLREAKLGHDHPHTLTNRSELAAAYELLGRWAEAEGLDSDTLARRRKTVQPDSPLLASDLVRLGHNLLNQERWSEAEPLLREALAIRAKASPDDWSRFTAMSLLGGALSGKAQYAEAEPLLVTGYDGMKAREPRIPVPERACLREAAERVIRLYEAWGKPKQAAVWKAKLGMPDLPANVFAQP